MLLLLGKSGSGKDTIKKELLKLGLDAVIPYTTRPPRLKDGEFEGNPYHFISDEQFMQYITEKKFAEYAGYTVSNGSRWYYGTTIKDYMNPQGFDKVAVLNPIAVKNLLKASKDPLRNFYIVYIEAPLETRLERCLKRGDSFDEVERRKEQDNIDYKDVYSYINAHFCNGGERDAATLARDIKKQYNDWKSRL